MGEIQHFHVMDTSSVPAAAFTEALSRHVDTTAWIPELSWFRDRAPLPSYVRQPGLQTIKFSLRRGYQYDALNKAFGTIDNLYARMAGQCRDAARTALICTSPYWTPLAEQWPGPVIYYSLDYTYAYAGVSPARILQLDRRLCHKAVRVFPVSRRIGDYFISRAGCAPEKITVLPNATLSQNVRVEADGCAAHRPEELKDVEGPIAGVIGNMADNLDWTLLQDCIEMTPWMHWAFIGPYDSNVTDRTQRKARNAVMRHSLTRFIGARRYDQLQTYARCLDVAVMPYRRKEPTYSGSATRFYEHLAAGRPIIATPNVAELLDKEPLLKLVDSASRLVEELTHLRENDFCDEWCKARVQASCHETWDVRAQVVLHEMKSVVVRRASLSDSPG